MLIHFHKMYIEHNFRSKMDLILMQAECSLMVNPMLLNLTDSLTQLKFMVNLTHHSLTVSPTALNLMVNLMSPSSMANLIVHNNMVSLFNNLIYQNLLLLIKISNKICKAQHNCLRLCKHQHINSGHKLKKFQSPISSLNLYSFPRLINSPRLRLSRSQMQPINKSQNLCLRFLTFKLLNRHFKMFPSPNQNKILKCRAMNSFKR
jgi:hypothetical protein